MTGDGDGVIGESPGMEVVASTRPGRNAVGPNSGRCGAKRDKDGWPLPSPSTCRTPDVRYPVDCGSIAEGEGALEDPGREARPGGRDTWAIHSSRPGLVSEAVLFYPILHGSVQKYSWKRERAASLSKGEPLGLRPTPSRRTVLPGLWHAKETVHKRFRSRDLEASPLPHCDPKAKVRRGSWPGQG